MTAKIII